MSETVAQLTRQLEEAQARIAELEQLVSEAECTKEEFARERNMLRSLLENSPDYVFFKDRDSRFLRTNKAHAQLLLGLQTPDEALGKTDFDLFPRQEAQRFFEEEQRVMATRQPVIAREWSLHSSATGKKVWLSEHKLPLLDEAGRVVGLLGIARDVTDRKEAEFHLKQAKSQLETAYSEITTLNGQLQEENLRMSAELSVARRLQEMILPLPDELASLPGIELVGCMQPAEEVGGDYYDVITENGTVHIGIGDVTGHGLESGMLMLMTQTAVRTLIACGATEPGTFLNTLNRVLYQNIQRMRVDKTIPLSLITLQRNRLRIVGQHEDVLVVRSDGTMECLDTTNLGFPLGLEEDIAGFVDETMVSLEAGDGIVLYTDGITEAENPQGELYGLERLCAVIGRHWPQAPQQIQDAVLDDVVRHCDDEKIHDDLTILVLKTTP